MWFQYPEKLNKDSFRIFTLEPGEERNDLHGSLQTHCLDAAPEYEALSYEWGDQTETTSMKCNNYTFKITKSLDVALRRLRLTNKPRSLWIDQICINQESYDECSAQVSIMRLIYSNAAMVIAWLGPADTEATNSVKNILTTLYNLEVYICNGDHFPDDDQLEKLNLPRRDSRAWNDLNLMLGASYFSRVLIIQELAVSSKCQLLWGDITISKDEFDSLGEKVFFLAMTEADTRKGCPKIRFTSIAFRVLRGKIEWDDQDLFGLVQQASKSKATVQQDKIYALIGLAGGCHYNMEPDYSKSESEVFADFATNVISTNKNLDILDYAYVEDPNEPKRSPRWAPRWCFEDRPVGLVHCEYNTSKAIKAIMKPSRKSNVLELRGLEVGVVNDLHHRTWQIEKDITAVLEIIKNHDFSFEQTYKLHVIKVIILTMMTGRERDVLWVAHPKRPDNESYLDNFITYVGMVLRYTGQSADPKTDIGLLFHLALHAKTSLALDEPRGGDASENQPTLDLIRTRHPDSPEQVAHARGIMMLLKSGLENQGWRKFRQSTSISQDLNFFITEKGYVGIGPRCMKAGDKVCVLVGGSTPYIIRPTSVADEYLYLGPAYVHGIMNGEVIDAWEKDKDSGNQEFQEKFFKLL